MQLAYQLRLGLEILRIARESEVPIYENAELVKLLARMELGDSIPEELYRTIAEIIAFAWNLKGKFPQGHDPNAPSVEKDVTDRGDDY
uniref:EscU/YscU/HrcU family type III secretion system export apparatus switch protein n=1 Tax=unclassified Pseudomonas TaxID=196821 RepID=UPI0030D82D83